METDQIDQRCQSCLNSITFPETWEKMRLMVDHRLEQYQTPMYALNTDLFFESPDAQSKNLSPLKGGVLLGWSAPHWFVEGDVSFFYYTKKALATSKKMYAMLNKFVTSGELPSDDPSAKDLRLLSRQEQESYLKLLERAFFFSTRYAGTIFAVGIASGGFRTSGDYYGQHWRANHYCAYSDVYVLDNPIAYDNFKQFVVTDGRTITPLTAASFNELRIVATATNPELSFLNSKTHRDVDIAEMAKAGGWRNVAKDSKIPFTFEIQVREYLVDGILNELVGENGSCFKEVESSHPVYGDGRIDYALQLEESIIPVEVKIRANFDDELASQLKKYCNAKITVRSRSKNTADRCILIDCEHLWLYTRPEGEDDSGEVTLVAKLCDLANHGDLKKHPKIRTIIYK